MKPVFKIYATSILSVSLISGLSSLAFAAKEPPRDKRFSCGEVIGTVNSGVHVEEISEFVSSNADSIVKNYKLDDRAKELLGFATPRIAVLNLKEISYISSHMGPQKPAERLGAAWNKILKHEVKIVSERDSLALAFLNAHAEDFKGPYTIEDAVRLSQIAETPSVSDEILITLVKLRRDTLNPRDIAKLAAATSSPDRLQALVYEYFVNREDTGRSHFEALVIMSANDWAANNRHLQETAKTGFGVDGKRAVLNVYETIVLLDGITDHTVARRLRLIYAQNNAVDLTAAEIVHLSDSTIDKEEHDEILLASMKSVGYQISKIGVSSVIKIAQAAHSKAIQDQIIKAFAFNNKARLGSNNMIDLGHAMFDKMAGDDLLNSLADAESGRLTPREVNAVRAAAHNHK